jgi:hypothetical protein
MKKPKLDKKLTLNRETLRLLEDRRLSGIEGGHSLADTLCVTCTTNATTCC